MYMLITPGWLFHPGVTSKTDHFLVSNVLFHEVNVHAIKWVCLFYGEGSGAVKGLQLSKGTPG